MGHLVSQKAKLIFLAALLFALFSPLSFSETCSGGLAGSNLQDCTGTDSSPCHVCDVTDMDFEIRAPDDVTTTGWVDMSYSTQSGTCSSTCTEEVWTNAYGYTFCPQEGSYDIRTRAYTNSAWEESAWSTGEYSVTWDTSSDWCECKTGSSGNWFSTVSGGSGGNCCGDDSTNDDFYYHDGSLTTATSLQCTICNNGTKWAPLNLNGNGYWSGSNTTTDTSGTCYYGDIGCSSSGGSSGASGTYYGNGYWSGSDPTTDTSGTCYYGDITCTDGSAAHGTSGTYYGNGYTPDSSTTDSSGTCYYGNITCSDGSASHGSSSTVYGNGYASGTTCYYGDWTCANENASNGSDCTLGCSGEGTTCCPSQGTYRDTVTCSEAGCGYTDHDRDDSEAYCTATASGCSSYTWDSLGSKCCGDDGSGDNFCTSGGGSCINGSWNADHCSDGVKNCDETGIDCGGTDCSTCPEDSTPPITSHDANTEWQTTNQTITLTCDDGSEFGATGCANTYYCIDDSNTCNPSIAGTSVEVNCDSGDVNKVFARFYSVDHNSNSETVQGVYMKIDKQKPSTASNASGEWSDSNFSLSLSCSDGNGAGCTTTYYRTESNPSHDSNIAGSFQEYSSAINFSSDGNYLVEFYSVDPFGHTEPTNSAIVLVDLGFASFGSAAAYSSYSDYNGIVVIPISTDGNHRIDYNSTDSIGNIESIRTGWAALDKSMPSTSDDLNEEWQNQNISITLSCSDTASGCSLTQYRLDSNSGSSATMGSWQNYSTAIELTSDGNWAIDYNSRDAAGWHETTNRVYALLDKTSPTISHNAPSDWVNSDQSVTLSPNDATSGILNTYYCIDDSNSCSPSTSGTSPEVTCTANSVCQKFLRFYTVDKAGNPSSLGGTLVKIDKELPITTSDANTQCQPQDQNITLSPSDGSGSGLANTYYCVDDSNTCSPETAGTSISVTCPEGTTCQKYVRYHSIDNAGNQESTHSVAITIDKGAPSTTDDANTQWQGSNQIITLFPSDGGGCGVTQTYYCVDSANTCSPSTEGTTVSVSCDAGSVCQEHVRYYSVDAGGHQESVNSVLIKIDRQAPIASHDANTAWVNANQTVNFSINDSSGCGGDSVYYCIDDSNACNPNLLSGSPTVACADNTACEQFLRFKPVDYVGNQGSVNAVLIRIDKNSPYTASDANSEWQYGDQVITLTPNDHSGSGIDATYYCTGSSNDCTPSIQDTSFTIYGIDNQVVNTYARYYSRDNANNSETVKSKNIRIDREKPSTTDDSNSAWQKNNVTVTLSPGDGSGSGIANTYYCIDEANSCTPSTSGTSVSVTCDSNTACQKYVRHYSVDSAGNQESTNSSSLIKIDKQAPTTTDNAPSAWQPENVTVTLSPSDASGSGIANTYYCVDLDGTPDCSPASQGTSVEVTCASGSVTQAHVRYYSVDSAGNQESINQALVKIDKETPTTTDNASSDWVNSNQAIALSPSDGNGSGIANTYYCIDSVNSCSPSMSGTSASVTCEEGTVCQKYVRYYSVDSAGNQETTKSSPVIRIDKNGPHTYNNITQDWYGDDFNVELTCDSVGGACEETTYRVNSGNWTVYSSSFTVTGSGINTLDFNSRDSLGNVEAIQTAYVRIDRTAPVTANDANTLWQNQDLLFSLTPSDSQSGPDTTAYCIDASNSCAPDTNSTSVTVTCTEGENCTKYVRYHSSDAVGNTESVKSVTVRIDKRDPATGAEAPDGCSSIDFNVSLLCLDPSGSGPSYINYRFNEEEWISSGALSQLPSNWWDANWHRRKKIVFDNSSEGEKSNYSVLLRLHSDNMNFMELQETGSDLRFVDGDHETELQYFVDTFSRPQQDAVIWVKVPKIDADSSTDNIWMYYSNSSADSNQAANWFD